MPIFTSQCTTNHTGRKPIHLLLPDTVKPYGLRNSINCYNVQACKVVTLHLMWLATVAHAVSYNKTYFAMPWVAMDLVQGKSAGRILLVSLNFGI